MKLTNTRAYHALARRQARHHELASQATTPRDQIAEELRHLRSITELINLDDRAAAARARAILAACTAEMAGLHLDIASGELVTR